ncbi:Transcriptional regulator GlxA family, contains an amidase domain and an AraC-type DNA-binding HTH domain [Chitinophaga eiseniae]|uniref:Transcriptional regulator GlxA family, contains an amidase domain and an AraC-type DNA-binding HTH domain n=1 Tax=Chitinophaga eiseniae TaxID=634771 RepID=A0A1T4NKE4_9BACT|nr:DJ-1/PfpI family protein [Chitinophaga eiseniae]SJZ79487.1 Transcriptional regulator GlxA family, contains an amidase domain and an AraC-type DNA-binding HTH domain [Chitinophaga eiseniae]
MIPNRVIFFLFDGVHLLDLAGAVTVFVEAICCGQPYDLRYVSPYPQPGSSSGLGFASVDPPTSVTVTKEDILIIAGMDLRRWDRADDALWIPWLQAAAASGATICSVCTAAFALAAAGLLDGQPCTTHWAQTTSLQQQFPRLKVVENRLFVKSGRIYTSAGIATGIDMALALIEERHGIAFASLLAKVLVVPMRRDGSSPQDSIFLQNRQHINHQIHAVQDYIISHLHQKMTIEELAEQVFISPRNLTRLFKSATGITIGEYIQKLRKEKALLLLKSGQKMTWVAKECGFKSPNQLRRLIQSPKAIELA